jgi:hypothetical protein
MKRLATLAVGFSFVASVFSVTAEARSSDPTWVPKRAWQAVQRYASQKYDPAARLFKTTETKAQSLGLKGAHSNAYVVGARTPERPQPHLGIMPYKPSQTFYLVTKNDSRRWEVTPLAGMGGYMTKVDAKADNPRVGVGVGLHTPGQVGHGVEVSNALRVDVTKGTALAAKRNRSLTHTVFVKGATEGSPYATNASATLRATVPSGGHFGVPYPKQIPVNFSQVFFAQPMAANR